MKIEINLKVIFIIILFFIFKNLDLYLIFVLFIFIHEIAHLLVGILIGGIPKKLIVNPLGLSLEFYSYGKNKTSLQILFYLIGPLINFICAIFFIKLKAKEEWIYTNFALCFFNLLPIVPLDGGKILKEIFTACFGIELSNTIMIYFSKICLGLISFIYSILILKIKNVYIVILLVYLWYLYFVEERKYIILKKTMKEIKKHDFTCCQNSNNI